MCTPSTIERHGAKPVSIKWTIVRGDTGTLTVDFLNNDETTFWDTTGWTYKATAYDTAGDVLDSLTAVGVGGSVQITAPASLTSNWGTAYKTVVAELPFDLQVTIPQMGENIIWTPVVGTICVIGNITPGGL